MSNLIREKKVKTRTEHTCWGCTQIIPKGTVVSFVKGRCDHQWFQSYYCHVCDFVISRRDCRDFEDGIMYGEIRDGDPEGWEQDKRYMEEQCMS